MASLFDDLKVGLQEALAFAKGEGVAKETRFEIVDEYLRTHNPSSMRTDIPFNLRGYVSYVDANHITNPNEISDDIIKSFFIVKDTEDVKILNAGTPLQKAMEDYDIKPEDLKGWEDVEIE